MANSGLLRSLISSSNPNKITPNFLPKLFPNFISRPFTSSEPNPSSSNLNLNPSNSSDPVAEPTQITAIDPFSKNPDGSGSEDRKNLVEELFKKRTEGMFVSAGKVFDRMSKRLRPFNNNRKFTHEAMERSKGHGRMPDVVAHIAVVEAYANAGLTNEKAHKVYLKMLGAGSVPNEHTFNMLIKLLASTSSGDWMMIGQAQKYMIEMLEKGMKPEAATSVAIFKALGKEGRVREGREFLEDLKKRGFVVDDKVFREIVKGRGGAVKVLKGKRGQAVRTVLEIFFGKKI